MVQCDANARADAHNRIPVLQARCQSLQLQLESLRRVHTRVPSVKTVQRVVAAWSRLLDPEYSVLDMMSLMASNLDSDRGAAAEVDEGHEVPAMHMEDVHGLMRQHCLCPICKDAPAILVWDGNETS